jgi:rod shape determining protein RodA
MIVERRLSGHLDWPLVAAVIALTGIGLATIYSVKWDVVNNSPGREFWQQLYALPVGLIALAVCLIVDYRTLAQRSVLVYAALVLGLVYVHFFGHSSGGAQRWIPIAGFTLQPSEFARVGLALVLAMFYGESRRSAKSIGELAIGAAFLAVPGYFIFKQPDLGTTAMLIPVYAGVVFLAGLRVRWLVAAAVVLTLLSPVIWKFGLHDYQKERVVSFIAPETDPLGKGYQQIQAKVTVGSGGLFGKGFRESTQATGGFLPVAHTDFVFSALAEEHGFLGVLVALGLYMFVISRSLEAAKLAKDRVGAYLVVGIVSGFACQVVYNITMSAGLAPVKGLTLPLMSYGGSSLVATLAGFGLVLNVRMRRFTN